MDITLKFKPEEAAQAALISSVIHDALLSGATRVGELTSGQVELVPAPPVPGITGGTVGVETDVNGHPWDERIHSSSKAKTQDGAWRYKRGVDDALVRQVEAEHNATPVIPSFFPAAQNAPAVPTPPTATPAVTYANIEALVTDRVKSAESPVEVIQTMQPVLARFGINSALDFKGKPQDVVEAGYYALLEAFNAPK